MLSKGMGEKFLLSKDEHLTPDIDGVASLWIFRRSAQNTKNGEKRASQFWYIIYVLGPRKRKFAQFFSGRALSEFPLAWDEKINRPRRYSPCFSQLWAAELIRRVFLRHSLFDASRPVPNHDQVTKFDMDADKKWLFSNPVTIWLE